MENLFQKFKESLGKYFYENCFNLACGVLYTLDNKINEASEKYKQGLKYNDQSWRLHLNYAYSLEQRNELSKALYEYQIVLDIEPYNLDCYLALGRIYERLKNIDAAKATYFLFIEKAKNHPQIYKIFQKLAKLYFQQSDFEKAQDMIMESIQHFPTSASKEIQASLYNDSGIVYCYQGLWDKAMFAFKKALSILPEYELASANLSLVKEKLNETQLIYD